MGFYQLVMSGWVFPVGLCLFSHPAHTTNPTTLPQQTQPYSVTPYTAGRPLSSGCPGVSAPVVTGPDDVNHSQSGSQV